MDGKPGLALWDFDGTLFRGDSFIEFLRFSHPGPRRYWCYLLFLPSFLAWKLGIHSAAEAKQRLFGLFFKGWTSARFSHVAYLFQKEVHPLRLDAKALSEVERLHTLGYRQVIVSATMHELLDATALRLGMELIATRIEVEGGLLTGRFASPNCSGPEKVRRLRERIDPGDYGNICAFGDSEGDREMLALAHHPGHRLFGR